MSRRRRLSDEERALWSGVAHSVKPLRSSAAATVADNESGEGAVIPPMPVPPRRPSRPVAQKPPPLAPFDRRLRQGIARGRDAIDIRIDLHGMTQSEAHAALLRFLRRAQADGARIALIVTGKGMGNAGRDAPSERGVLRRQVPLWLALPEFRRFIIGFEEAHVTHGGQGALYLRLRRSR